MCEFLLVGGHHSRRPSPRQYRGPLLVEALRLWDRLPHRRLRLSLRRALAQSVVPWGPTVP